MIRAVFFDLGDTLVPEEGDAKTLPHAREVLQELKSKCRLAVICNATVATEKHVREILRGAEIEEFFDAVVVSTDVGYRSLMKIFSGSPLGNLALRLRRR